MTAAAARQPAAAPLPPQNLDAEESVLGAMLISPQAIDTSREILGDGRDFYRESHTLIYRAALALHGRGEPVDAITVADELDQDGRLDRVGGKERIHELAVLVPAAANAGHYAQIVRKLATFRGLTALGERIQRLGWEAEGDAETAIAEALELTTGYANRGTQHDTVELETWHQFESKAHDRIPTLIDRLWPEAAFGFIAAPPKKGKTWLALAHAIAVSTGRPFLGHFTIPEPRPTVYVALEGHRAAIRARVGAVARGMGLNPDGADLDNLHWLYKPAGINLADPSWARTVQRKAETVGAAIVYVDVLRAAARIKENDQSEFAALRANLQPLTDAGISIAMLHHFGKLSELQRDRDPGERMSGTGAMFGALDVAIYITGSEDGARRLRLEFDTRDLAHPENLNVQITGDGGGDNGGYTYRDTATFEVVDDEVAADDFKKAPPQEIYDYVVAEGGDVLSRDVRAVFEIGEATLTRRLGRLLEMGVTYRGGRGKPGRLVLVDEEPEDLQERLEMGDSAVPTWPNGGTSAETAQQSQKVPPHPEFRHGGTSADEGTDPLNHAGSSEVPPSSHIDPCGNSESGDLQGKAVPQVPPSPTESAYARARETPSVNGAADPDHDELERLADIARDAEANGTAAPSLDDELDWSSS